MKKIIKIQDYIVRPEDMLRHAMQVLDKAGTRIIFVAENNEKLFGSLSDGDIRRYILSGGKVEDSVSLAANRNCISLGDSNPLIIKNIIKEKQINGLPVTDKDKRIICIYFNDDLILNSAKTSINLPVVIQAGGMGTRLYPYTHILPKPLIPIGDKPITELIINSFLEFGCNEFFMIINHKKSMIKAYYADIEKRYKLTFIEEDFPLGTAGGLGLLKGMINSPFFFTNCDILLDADYNDIYQTHKDKKNIATIVSVMKHYQIPYGVLDLDNNGKLIGMTEKPQIDYITNTGVYLLNSEVIDMVKPNQSITMPELLQKYVDCEQAVGIYPITDSCWNDMGQISELQKMQDKICK